MPSPSIGLHGATSGFSTSWLLEPSRKPRHHSEGSTSCFAGGSRAGADTLALAPRCPAPHPSRAAGLFCRVVAAFTPLVQPTASLWPPGLLGRAFCGPPLNLNVGQSVSGRSCCLLCTRAGLFSGTRKPASFWVRQHGLQHCSSGVEGLSIPVGILQQTSASHPLVKSGIYTLGIRSTSHGSRQHTYTGYNPGKKTVTSCGDS